MAEYTDKAGVTHTGLAAFNAKRRDEKAAAAGGAAPAAAAPAAAPAPEAPKAGRPKVNTPAPEAAPAAPVAPAQVDPEVDYYNDILDAVQAADKGFALQSTTETAHQYLTRLLTAVLAVPESVLTWDDGINGFKELKAGSNAWITAATNAMNGEPPQPLPTDLSGFVDKFTPSTGKSKGRKAKAKEPREPKAPREKKVKEKKVRAVKEDGFVRWVRGTVIRNPGITLPELKAEADVKFATSEKKPSENTLALSRHSCLMFIELAKAAGKWKD